jgi:hypothetical protein
MKLKRDEKVIMDNGPLGLKKKLTLTNKRLIFQKDEGIFNVKWNQEKVIPLNNIEDVYLETKAFTGKSSMKVKLKKGKRFELSLSLGDSWLLNDSSEDKMEKEKSTQLKMLHYRWVKAITNQLMRLDEEKKTLEIKEKTEYIQDCPKCGKKITKENYKYCPFCGRLLKSKYLF